MRALLALAALGLGGPALAQVPVAPVAQAVQRGIQLGGDARQWDGLPQYPVILSNSLPARPVSARGHFSLAWDAAALYVRGVFEQDSSTLLARNPADAPQWWSDDAMELFFRPDPRLIGGVLHYAANPRGTRFRAATAGDDYRAVSRVEAGRWILELAFPWSPARPRPQAGQVWGLKVGREHHRLQEYPLWPSGGDFNAGNNFGSLVFTERLENDAYLQARVSALEAAPAPAGAPIKSRLAGIQSFAVYYGTNRAYADLLVNFDLAIVQPNTVTFRQLQALKAQGVRVVAYLSVGEAEGSMVGLPKEWILGTNPNWGSRFADANQRGWREQVYRWAKDILDIGFDGLFLDTVDTVDVFPATKPGMVELIRGLRQRFPSAVIVQNRGFAVLPQTAEALDAVMFESFSTDYNFKTQTYFAHDGDPRPLKPYLARGLPVLALDYALPTQQDLITRIYTRARQHGFIPFTTTISLTELTLPNP